MASRKKAAATAQPEPQVPKKTRKPRECMALGMTAEQTARFEALVADYGLKPRAARDKAENLIEALLTALEELLSKERTEAAQMEISDLERLLEAKRAALAGGMTQAEENSA